MTASTPISTGESRRGALIALEGCDRAGKSTQCRLLVEHFQATGVACRLVRFPDRSTAIGKCIDAYLKQAVEMDDHAVHLLFSANRWELLDSIKKDLEAGISVILDRYAYSGVAFSVAKGLDSEWCKTCDKGLLKPDRIFFLDLPMEEVSRRGGFGEERYETAEFQTKVRRCFNEWIGKDASWTVVDARQTQEQIFKSLQMQINDIISMPKNAVSNDLFL